MPQPKSNWRGGRAGAQGLDAIRQATLNMLADNLD